MTLEERRALLSELEKRIQRDQARRRELLCEDEVAVDDRELAGWDGPVRLSALFGEKDELLFVHNMGARCPYCTLWADGFNGILPHLESRAAFVLCSPDPPEAQRSFAQGRGWRFRMVHDAGAALTRELGYTAEAEGERRFLPGVSVLVRDAEGAIRRVARDAFGPGDPYCGIWHLLALLPDGVGGWEPRFRYD